MASTFSILQKILKREEEWRLSKKWNSSIDTKNKGYCKEV